MTRQFTAGVATGILVVGLVGYTAFATHIPPTTAAATNAAPPTATPAPQNAQVRAVRVMRMGGPAGGALVIDAAQGVATIVTVSSINGQTITATLGQRGGMGGALAAGPGFCVGMAGPPLPGNGTTISGTVSPTSTIQISPPPPGAGPGVAISGTAAVTSTLPPLLPQPGIGVAVSGPITLTIAVSSTTTFTRAGQPAGLSDIQPGSVLAVQGQLTGPTTLAASSVQIVLPTQTGVVTAIDGDDVTITGLDARIYTVVLGAGTAYRRADQTAAQTDLGVGSLVTVEGTSGPNATIDALRVTIVLPRVAGQVTALSGDDVTVQSADGITSTVHLTATTTYHTAKAGAAGRGDVTTGSFISAEGTPAADGSLTALSVDVADLAGPGAGPQVYAVPIPGAAPAKAFGACSISIQVSGSDAGAAFGSGDSASAGPSSTSGSTTSRAGF
jgi:hypothetical protein